MQHVNWLRCRSIPMCLAVSITPPVVVNCRWSRRALRRSPFSYSRSDLPALRWRSGHRSDQSPLRGQTPQTNMQPVTCLLRTRLPSSEAYPARAYSFIPSPLGDFRGEELFAESCGFLRILFPEHKTEGREPENPVTVYRMSRHSA